MTRLTLSARYAGAKLPLKKALKQQEQPAPRFLADAMLGNIARKLRAFGFDTAYLAHTHDDEVMRVGRAEGRTILTADKELFKRMVAGRLAGVLVDCHSEFEDIAHILAKTGVTSIGMHSDHERSSRPPRCSLCNGLLKGRNPSQIDGLVPQPLLARHNKFFQCTSCTKVYWPGGHFKRLSDLAGRLDALLAAQGSSSGAKKKGAPPPHRQKHAQATKG